MRGHRGKGTPGSLQAYLGHKNIQHTGPVYRTRPEPVQEFLAIETEQGDDRREAALRSRTASGGAFGSYAPKAGAGALDGAADHAKAEAASPHILAGRW
jgi:hypothetical protein